MAGLHDGYVFAAYAEGLSCRPVHVTVADTWHWLQAAGYPNPRGDRPPLGPPPEVEQAVTAAAETASQSDQREAGQVNGRIHRP